MMIIKFFLFRECNSSRNKDYANIIFIPGNGINVIAGQLIRIWKGVSQLKKVNSHVGTVMINGVSLRTASKKKELSYRMKRVIMAVTGASGAIYARKVAERLVSCGDLEHVALIVSDHGREVMAYERQTLPQDSRITEYDNSDMFAAPASGNAGYEGMIIVPCTMGTAGRIANGISSGLIGRAADVMLKERRPLILVIRETPLNTIHLRNLTTLSECGAVILPASPYFYRHAQSIEDLCDGIAVRAVGMLGIRTDDYRWGDDSGQE